MEGARASRADQRGGRGDQRLHPEAWVEALPLRQVLSELGEMLPRGLTVVPAGQNVRMDVQFLERAYKSCALPFPFDYHVIDLATLFYAWSLVVGETLPALSLRQAATNAGLIDGAVPHRAMADSRLTLETFRYFVGRLAPRGPSEAAPPAPSGPQRIVREPAAPLPDRQSDPRARAAAARRAPRDRPAGS